VVERLGVYYKTCEAGLHFIVPFVDRIKNKIELKDQIVEMAQQAFTTKDNITVKIDATVVYMVSDEKLYTYGVKSPKKAIEEFTATTLRSIMWDLGLTEIFASRNLINTKTKDNLNEATGAWGIKIIRVEVKNIIE